MAADPGICAATVGTNTPEVNEDAENEEGHDDGLGLEVAPGDALVNVVPLGVGTVGDVDLCAKRLVCAWCSESARQRCRCGRRSICKVGKVWQQRRQCLYHACIHVGPLVLKPAGIEMNVPESADGTALPTDDCAPPNRPLTKSAIVSIAR